MRGFVNKKVFFKLRQKVFSRGATVAFYVDRAIKTIVLYKFTNAKYTNYMNNTYELNKSKSGNKLLSFIVCVGGTLIAGFLAGYFGQSFKGYAGLVTPPATPPDIVFAIVWPILYAMIGFSLHRVLTAPAYTQEQTSYKQISSALWVAGLIINISWVPLFFIARIYSFTFIWLGALLAITVIQMILNYKIDKLSFWLLVPYAMWLAFAAYLNLFIAILN